MNFLLETAKTWRDLGIATIPILARDKRPALETWKRYQTELPTMRQLELWFGSGRYNLAVITGWRGLVVLDFDDLNRCFSWISELSPDILGILNETFQVSTNRGMHYYFFSNHDTKCVPGDGWDVKADGGYVLAPPSIHPSGTTYQALGDPQDIRPIQSIWEFVEKPAKPAWTPSVPKLDPFDQAMRDNGNGASIETAKRHHTPASILGVSHNGRRIMTRCPLPNHQDQHESFAIYGEHFHCFGCGAHGDAIDLYALIHQVSLSDAIRELSN